MTPQEKARALRPLIEKAAASLSDRDALDGVELFPLWRPGLRCEAGQTLRHEGRLYRVIQGHTTQADWPPPRVPALFEERRTHADL